MKKFKLGLMALALTIGIAGAFASNQKIQHKKFTGLFWYNVDSNQKTVGSPVYSNDTKNQALAEPTQICNDSENQPMCQFGSTSGSLPTGTDASGADSAHKILQTQQ